jgi:hypothetical protein
MKLYTNKLISENSGSIIYNLEDRNKPISCNERNFSYLSRSPRKVNFSKEKNEKLRTICDDLKDTKKFKFSSKYKVVTSLDYKNNEKSKLHPWSPTIELEN